MTTKTNTASTARERLVTSRQTGGVTVRLKPEGIAKLVAAGNAGDTAKLQRLLPRLAEEQRPLLLEQLSDEARAAVLQQPRRRPGKPQGEASKSSPVAIARDHTGTTQAGLAERLGKRDSAVRNAEARGFGVTLTTLAEYLDGLDARVEVVITHADGTEARIPVPADKAA